MITETLIQLPTYFWAFYNGDLSFNRSVILLADHDKEGQYLPYKKPLKYTINDLLPEVNARFKIYNGGPVEQDNLILFTIFWIIPNSIEISNGIYWGDFESTKELIINDGNRKEIFVFLGYTGGKSIRNRDEFKLGLWPKNYKKIK
jgi:putative transcriptional regulator